MKGTNDNGKRWRQTLLFSMRLISALLMLYPLYYTLLGSLCTKEEFYRTLFLPIPGTLNGFSNFLTVFKVDAFVNSLITTVLKLAVQLAATVLTSVLAGYVFAKVRIPFKRGLFLILISSMMIPGVAMMVPNYIWMARFPLAGGNNILGQGGSGFLNNLSLHLVTGWVNVYNIFLCRQAFSSLGNEMAESAQIDGAGFFRIVFTIYVPLIRAVLAVMFLNLFLSIWNDYLTNFIYMRNAEKWHTVGNIVVKLMGIYADETALGGADYPAAFAVALVNMVPPIIVLVCIQKQFTEGLTVGAVKG